MSAAQLIADMKSQGVFLWAEQGNLHYRAPDHVMNESMLKKLKKNKDKILGYLAEASDESVPQLCPQPGDRYRPFPVTDIQRAYLLGRSHSFELGNTGCHLYFELESPNLDIHRLEQAWQQLIQRHDLLRATFPSENTQQILETVPPYEIEVIDLSVQPVPWRKWMRDDIRSAMSHQLFKANQWPLFDLKASITPENVRLHFSLDLLIADFYSTNLLFKELHFLYEQSDEVLPPLNVSFRDCVLVMDELRRSPGYERAKAYWINRLDALPPAPKLPLAVHPDAITKPWFKRRRFQLPKQDWERLQRFSKASEITSSAALAAVYAEVLSYWSSSAVFTLNLTLFNRPDMHEKIMDVVGDFTSVNLLEVDGSAPASFKEKALRIQRQLWDDLDHSLYSGVEVMRALSARSQGQSDALMPVVFSSTIGLDSPLPDGFDLSRLGKINYMITQTPQVFIDYQVREEAGSLVVTWDALEDLFPDGLLDQMFEAHGRMLERLSRSETHWHEIVPALIPKSQHKVRETANATDSPLSSETLYSLFIKQVNNNPEQTAIVSGTTRFSYRELYEKSNGVARILIEGGFAKGDRVAIVMEKGWEQVAAALGVLAAGGVYLPVDPNLPRERVLFLLENGTIGQVLTQHHLKGLLPASIRMIFVDQLDGVAEFSIEGPVPEDMAYIIYTSGSTGAPKGVMINHQGAVNTITDIIQKFELTGKDRVLGLSNLSFDLSVFDLFGTLAAGATLILPDHNHSKEPEHWTELILEEGVTVWNSVPSLMQMMVDHHGDFFQKQLQTLDLVLLSGDWIPMALPERIRKLAPNCRVIGLGGATEASIWSIYFPIHDVSPQWKSIPYGKPLVNQRFHILNDQMNPCPDWVPGKIYIEGTGLALGYWRDEKKTEQHFIRHPHTGERLYQTGDIGRYLPDGNIEFMGREDSQVKIRGYRIELGEVEGALKRIPGVHDAAVTVSQVSGKNNHLVGHIVLKDMKSPQEISSSGSQMEADGNWNDLVAAGNLRAGQWEDDLDPMTLEKMQSEMERISISSMCTTLRKMNVFKQAGESHSLKELISECRIHESYHRLFRRWLQTLVREGILIKTGENTFTCSTPLAAKGEEAHLSAFSNQFKDEKAMEVYQTYLNQSREHLVALMQGEKDALELFFSGGSSETADSVYRNNPVSIYHNGIIKALLCAVTEQRKGRGPLRVLEIGAGVGGTTSFLLPALAGKEVEYTYTDVSSYFLNKARQRFEAYPFVRYEFLDLNRPPQAQGVQDNSFDVIISGGVLHSIENIPRALGYLDRMLSPGGFLLILEVTHDSNLMQVTMEFLAGMNQFEDSIRRRENSPFLTTKLWQEVLAEAGFDKVSIFPGDAIHIGGFGQHVLLAGKSAVDGDGLDHASLKHFLGGILPSYTIPATFTRWESFPLNSSGKIDRKALLRSDTSVDESPQKTQERQGGDPRNAVEQGLKEIWQEMFRQEDISIHDNFFELGGDSLLLVQLATGIRKRFGDDVQKALKMKVILEAPTIAELALLLIPESGLEDNRRAIASVTTQHAPIVFMKPEGHLTPFFCVHDGTLTLHTLRNLPQYFDLHRPLYGFEVKDLDGYHRREPKQLIQSIAREYVDAIQNLQPNGPYLVGGYCMGGIVAFEIASLLEQRGETVARLVLISCGPPSTWVEDEVLLHYMFSKLWGISFERFGLHFDVNDDKEFLSIIFASSPDGIPLGYMSEHFKKESYCSTLAAYRYARLEAMGFEERLGKFYMALSDSVPRFTSLPFDQFKTMYKTYRTSYNGAARFKPGTFSGTIDFVRPEEARYRLSHKWDVVTFWKEHAQNGIRVIPVTGGHLTCLEEPHISFTAHSINTVLKSSGY